MHTRVTFDKHPTVSRRLLYHGVSGSILGQVIVGSVMDEVAFERDFSEYFGFPRKFTLYQLLHIRSPLSESCRFLFRN
jgi:hypothetical protein